MSKRTPQILVGDLLVKSGIVDRSSLADALPIALKTGLPVGRILISSSGLNEKTLQAAIFAQSLVRDCLIARDLAVRALKIVDDEKIELGEALARLGWRSEAYELTNRLGQLFLDAGMITQEELEDGLQGFNTAGLPLARILVAQGVINNKTAFAALNAQKLVRDGVVSREQAIEALVSAVENASTIEETLTLKGFYDLVGPHTIRLGELLVLAGLTTEADLLENVERSLAYEEFIGETFVNTGQLRHSLLDAALELQRRCNQQQLEPLQAAEALRRIAATDMSVDDAVHEVTAPPEVRAKLLGLFSDNQDVAAKHELPAEETMKDELNKEDAAASVEDDPAAPFLSAMKEALLQGNVSAPAEVQAELLKLFVPGKVATVPRPVKPAVQRSTPSTESQRQTEVLNKRRYIRSLRRLATKELRDILRRNGTRLPRRWRNSDEPRRRADGLESLSAPGEHHMRLVNKLIGRVEELSYTSGYLAALLKADGIEEIVDLPGARIGRPGKAKRTANQGS